MRPMQQHRPELLGRRFVEIRFVFRGLSRQVQNTTRTVSSSDSGEVAMSRKKCNNRKMETIVYEKPLVEVFDICAEGVICRSGKSEDYDPADGTW